MGPLEILWIGATSLLVLAPTVALLGWAVWVTVTLRDLKRRVHTDPKD